LDTENRAKGNAAGQFVAGIAGIVGQYSTGVALGKIQYYYYIVFIFWDIFEVIIVYLFFPETKVSPDNSLIIDSTTNIRIGPHLGGNQ
jgi:NADH:ubiquinone oxidoreductase subunit 3 (subunit A)